jgi:lysophospholipase L1-like esterase
MGAMPVAPQPRTFARFVAVGDSFTEGLSDAHPEATDTYVGWADRLAAHLAEDAAREGRVFGYANLAVRGRLLEDIAGRQVDDALALHPDLVSIVGGGNDLLRARADVDAVAERLDDAVARIRSTGAAVLLATSVDPGDVPVLRRTRGRYGIYAAHLWSIARRHEASVVDLWGLRALRDPRLWAADRIHLTSEGHRRVAASAYTALGFAVDDVNWSTPLPPAPQIRRGQRMTENARWAREHLAPWVRRRVRGASSGDAVTAKRPAVTPVD